MIKQLQDLADKYNMEFDNVEFYFIFRAKDSGSFIKLPDDYSIEDIEQHLKEFNAGITDDLFNKCLSNERRYNKNNYGIY